MIKITSTQAKQENWDEVQTLNYKYPEKSVVTATLKGSHGWRISAANGYYYYILSGGGIFETETEKIKVNEKDTIFIPPHTNYNYYPISGTTLKIVLFMNPWNN